MERHVRGAGRATMPGAGHFMSEQDPAAFNSAVLGFLRERQ